MSDVKFPPMPATLSVYADASDVQALRLQHDESEISNLKTALDRANALLARCHALLEMADKSPTKLLGEIATHLGWAQEAAPQQTPIAPKETSGQ